MKKKKHRKIRRKLGLPEEYDLRNAYVPLQRVITDKELDDFFDAPVGDTFRLIPAPPMPWYEHPIRALFRFWYWLTFIPKIKYPAEYNTSIVKK